MPTLNDEARQWTDEQLGELERRIHREYTQASREMRGKYAKWLEEYAREREKELAKLDGTPESKKAYQKWCREQASKKAWYEDMVNELSASANQANRRAADLVNDALPRVYAENANWAAFAIDKAARVDTKFTLVNEDAVRYLMGLRTQGADPDQLVREVAWFMPQPEREAVQSVRVREIQQAADIRWNRQKFTSVITQGILQGESVPHIADRAAEIFGQNRTAALRAARTATTNAENAGRMSSFERAQRLGIDMELEWVATSDDRTRDSHLRLDGERIQLGETFSNGLRWPGDPQGEPGEVWNCRCRASGRVVGFDGQRGSWADDEDSESSGWTRLPSGMTYEQWKAGKAELVTGSAVDPTAAVWQGEGAQALEHATELLAAASDEAAAAWKTYESGFRLADARSANSFFDPVAETVAMDVAADMKNPLGPLETWFHEFGHAIDRAAGKRAGKPLISYARGLHTTAKNEVDELVSARWKALKAEVKTSEYREWASDVWTGRAGTIEDFDRAARMGFIPTYYRDLFVKGDSRVTDLPFAAFMPEPGKDAAKKYAYQQISNDLKAMPGTSQHRLADIIEAATGGKARGKYGHGKAYWQRGDEKPATEAFANLYSASVVESASPEAMATLREWLPETVKKFTEILEEAAGL